MRENAPIGLYDSGVGGLTVVREVFRQLPAEAIVYFGDTARVPYGGRSPEEIIGFNREAIDMLTRSGCKAIVIACNTSSALALPGLQAHCEVPLIGVIQPGAEAVMALAEGRTSLDVAVLATTATVKRQAYSRALNGLIALRRPGFQMSIRERACPGLVPMLERGVFTGAEAEAAVAAALGPFLTAMPDVLVLGCTHYPLVAPIMARFLPGVTIIDPAARAVSRLTARLAHLGLLSNSKPVQNRFFVSGDPEAFFKAARLILPDAVRRVQQVPVATPAPVPTLRVATWVDELAHTGVVAQ